MSRRPRRTHFDAFFPEVGIATLELLERFGCTVDYSLDQTCCGQPMVNSGCQSVLRRTACTTGVCPIAVNCSRT